MPSLVLCFLVELTVILDSVASILGCAALVERRTNRGPHRLVRNFGAGEQVISEDLAPQIVPILIVVHQLAPVGRDQRDADLLSACLAMNLSIIGLVLPFGKAAVRIHGGRGGRLAATIDIIRLMSGEEGIAWVAQLDGGHTRVRLAEVRDDRF